MGQLSGLKGTNGEAIECIFIEKSGDIEAILNKGLAATSAGDKGAMNIYKDDSGFIRCELMKFCITIESKKFRSLKPAIKWVDKWLPLIN